MKTIVLYATDTMADWEYSYFVAGLAMARGQGDDRYRLQVLSDGAEEVTTLGGIRVSPDGDLADLDVSSVAALILPGGDTWNEGHEKVLGLAAALLEVGTPVGAICGATLGVARVGLLNARPHTSNALEFLGQATEYAGAEHYLDEKTVSDGTLVTAPGTAPLEFSKALFELLELLPQPIIDAWYGLYTTGDKKYYEQLAGAQ
ncbi:DJ-1/PfpI family protein [Rhodococcoides kyotonense]|uniref:DJ-1/PfpI family protein n=1 Tax=Rhodococcoides kyotonense TaxID=398843 RepID=A0A239L6M2_9NOCA|nr:DJ-1/PfpI family protein [Rhodococcus kyotonensis]SNT25940.1 DJ-1/PfpI family protein [Rhodococcus kyotonensis]